MHLINRANQVDEIKRSSKGEVPGSRLLEAEGALMEGRSRAPTDSVSGRRSSRGETPSGYPPGGPQAASPAAFSDGAAPKRRSSKGSGSSKGLGRRSSRGTLPEGTPPAGYPPSGQCGCCDPSGRGAAANAAPSHRAAPVLAPSQRVEPGLRADPRRSFRDSQRVPCRLARCLSRRWRWERGASCAHTLRLRLRPRRRRCRREDHLLLRWRQKVDQILRRARCQARSQARCRPSGRAPAGG